MKLSETMNDAMRRGLFALRKAGPDIMVKAGVVGLIGGGVMACFATLKLEPVMQAHRESAERVRSEKHEDERETSKAMTAVYLKTGAELAKLYGPAVAVSAVSATGVLAGNHILGKRHAALAAAYATVDASFRRYRAAVAERHGENEDAEIRAGAHTQKIDVVETDENGKEKKAKKSVMVMDGAPADYARIFAVGEAEAAEPNADYNLFFLNAQQEMANYMLRKNGHLFLNEVYDMLGIERSVAGQAVGWLYDKNEEHEGDNFVDFGITEVYRKRSEKPNDYEKVYLLNFNVDGGILTRSLDKGLITK